MVKTKELSEEMARELCGERDIIAKYTSHIFYVPCQSLGVFYVSPCFQCTYLSKRIHPLTKQVF